MKSVLAILVLVLALPGFVIFFRKFRIEGLAAIHVNGLHLFFFFTYLAGVEVPTEITGLFTAVTGTICILAWTIRRRADSYLELPKALSPASVCLAVLFVLWFGHHLFERGTSALFYKMEYYKWAYYLTGWLLPLVLGFVFPCSAERVQRFLRAVGVIGLAMAGLVLVTYFLGFEDISKYGQRYSISDQMTSLDYGIASSIATGCMLGGYFVCQERLRTGRLLFVGFATLAFLTAAILGGTRSSLMAVIVASIAALATFRFRYLPISIAVAGLAFVVAIFIVVPMLPEASVQRSLSWEVINAGFQNRKSLLLQSLTILEISPLVGKTVGLYDILGESYSHNFTSQVLFETGLLGFSLYLVASLIIVTKWIRMLLHKKSPLFAIGAPLMVVMSAVFLEAHAHGSLRNNAFWMLLGLMASHNIHHAHLVSPQEQMDEEAVELTMTTAAS